MIRRDFFKYTFLTTATLTSLNANTKKDDNSTVKTDIAILGGGFAGLSCAKELKRLNPNLDVTIIEKKESFTSCPFSNLWLGETQGISYENLNYPYNDAIIKYNYNFLNETIIDVKKDKKIVITDKNSIKYKYLVLALGIDYDYSYLFKDKKKIEKAKLFAPAGLKPGSEHLKIKESIKNFKTGNFIITVPPFSYKCPPAPYERACMIANYFKKNNINGKVIVLDPREKPLAKPKKILKAFSNFYKEYITYIPNSKILDVEFEKKNLSYEFFDEQELENKKLKIQYSQLCLMPKNKANSLIEKIGLELTPDGWAKLKEPTFRSTVDENIYVIGDAQGTYPFPKSAQMANSCAYIVANEIVNTIAKIPFDYRKNLPGNICYSMITDDLATSVTHSYLYTNKMNLSVSVSNIDKYTAQAAYGWYFGLIEDILAIK
ncbi:MAG: FAD-dependent oxidoreductase [Halarcobacter sp.]